MIKQILIAVSLLALVAPAVDAAGLFRGRRAPTEDVLLFSVLGDEVRWQDLSGSTCTIHLLEGRLIKQASGLKLGHRYKPRLRYEADGFVTLLGWRHKGAGPPLTINSPCADQPVEITPEAVVFVLGDNGLDLPASRARWTWRSVVGALRNVACADRPENRVAAVEAEPFCSPDADLYFVCGGVTEAVRSMVRNGKAFHHGLEGTSEFCTEKTKGSK